MTRAIRNLSLIFLGLMIVAVPTLHECEDLMDCQKISGVPSFETEHPHEMASHPPHNFCGLAPGASSSLHLEEPNSGGVISVVFSLLPSSTCQFLSLRC